MKLSKKIANGLKPLWYARCFKHSKIMEKTILYQAYRNCIMAGNPYGIFCRLIDDPAYRDFTHIWIYRDDENLNDNTFQRYGGRPNVLYVKSQSREYFRYLATCQYLISNSALPSYWVKKEGQIYINTWHGTPLKMLGRDAKDRNPASIQNAQRNFFSCDYLVMPNRYTIDRMTEAYDLEGMFTGQILDAGYPRTDRVLHGDREHIIGLLEKRLGASLTDKKIVLYAPTFRSVEGKSIDTSQEVGEYMTALLEALPPGYELFFKVHNMMASFFSGDSQMKGRLIFDEIETNELLSVTDVLITDYSSIFFDFLCRQKPILFFVYDRQEYADGRGLYRPLEDLPGALCETVDEIRENFLKIQDGSYDHRANMDRALREFAYNDDGEAAQRVVDIIFGQKTGMKEYLYQPAAPKERILVLSGGYHVPENKWQCIRTLEKLDCAQDTVCLLAPDIFAAAEEWDALPEGVRLIDSQPTFLMTLFEKVCYKIFRKVPGNTAFLKRQYQKYFGGLHFSKVIGVSGSDPLWKKILASHCVSYTAVPKIKNADQSRKLRQEMDHPMTVLFLAAFDSVNYVYVNMIRELEKRGHRTILVVLDAKDAVNNRMFTAEQIPFTALADLSPHALSEVDFVVSTPFLNVKTRDLRKMIDRHRIFCISFANLFSSIAMRVYTDLIFTIGTSKFQEFEENGFHYSMVAAGNPQYDELIADRKAPGSEKTENIKRVLFIDQGGYPFGAEGKRLLGQVLLAMAGHHPDLDFVVKPRFLPDELEGELLHRPSEHLYDFIPDPPANLLLLREPTILEDMIKDFDAMVTMWSTAYLDAALRSMPIMLISGLPSQEVFDVRVQRIEEAFARLEHTGCVVGYQDVLKGHLEFRYVDEAYLKEEVEIIDESCTPLIVDTLEELYDRLIIPGKRLADVVQTDIRTFRDRLPDLPTIDVWGNAYLQRRNFLKNLNSKLQALAFINRCMAKPFDMRPLLRYWSLQPGENFKKWRVKILNLRLKLDVEKVKRRYFCSSQISTETDPIRLDHYYDWLFIRKKYERILNFDNPHVFPETKAYYRAMVYFQKARYPDAAREFAAYYHHIKQLDVKPLKKDRKIDLSRLPKGKKRQPLWDALRAMGEHEILEEIETR